MERWFAERRKNKVLDIAYRQMTLSLDTVSALEDAINRIIAGDRKGALSRIDRLFVVEENIDTLRRAVLEELRKGSLPPKDREDIMHLVKRLDVMADHVKDSARNVIVLSDADLPVEIWKEYGRMASGLLKSAKVLRRSLEKVFVDRKEARRLSQRVDDEEKKVDQIHLEIKSLLLKSWSNLNPAEIIILKDLLDSMEHVADACDDTADYIRLLTVPS